MDLRLSGAVATVDEHAALDAVLGRASSAWRGGTRDDVGVRSDDRTIDPVAGRRDLLLPALHALQDRVGGITKGGLEEICRRLGVPPADAFGVASFYALFSLGDTVPRALHVCDDIACIMAGAKVPEQVGSGTAVHRSPCLGLCERAPAALLVEAGAAPMASAITGVTDEAIESILGGHAPPRPDLPALPQAGAPGLVLLRRVGVVDPQSLADYRRHGGYAALERALELGPAAVIDAVSASGLLGRGGAAFPTARKWAAVAAQPVWPHYLVANADESEPGTFKDRVLMERDPYALVEAMTIAGVATGCQRGYLYIRGEYPLAWTRMLHAVGEARAARLLGDSVLDRGIRFDIELRKGAGAYICGEETAIFNSIEGHRGEPRPKPPFPVEVGLFGKPTLVNNVETLVNVLPILIDGPEAFCRLGTPQSTGTKLFCLCGRVARPGLYEVPFGTTLRELIDLAGGVPDGRATRTVLLGGAAGTFVAPDHLDVPLTFEGVRTIGASLGSGVVMVVDDSVELAPLVLRIASFFRDESCGQCVPCRLGTARQVELLTRLTGDLRDGDLTMLDDVGRAMRDASICGLGQTAYNAVESAVRLGLVAGRRR